MVISHTDDLKAVIFFVCSPYIIKIELYLTLPNAFTV